MSQLVTLGSREYEVAGDEMAKINAAVMTAWKPILSSFRARLSFARATWDAHRKLRDESLFTAMIVEAAGFTGFPKASVIADADASLAKLESAIASGNFKVVPSAFKVAKNALQMAVTAVQEYHEALCKGGGRTVALLKATAEAAKEILDITSQLATVGKPGLSTVAAAGVGSYKELLSQIEKSQASDEAGNIGTAAVIVLSAGAREGFLKALMKDGALGKELVGKLTGLAGASLINRLGNATAERIIGKMVESGLEETITVSLRDLINNYSSNDNFTLKKAAEHVAKEVLRKETSLLLLSKFDKQLDTVCDKIVQSVKKGEIRGLTISNVKDEKELLKLINDTVEDKAKNFLERNANIMRRLEDMNDSLVKEVLNDNKFRTEAGKATQSRK